MYFFDLDGTLLDSNGIWLDIDMDFLGRHGIAPVPEDYTEYVTHHSAPDAAVYTRERFHLSLSPQEIMKAWIDMARQAYACRLPLKPGARQALLRCRSVGRRAAVLTSCIPEPCSAALERHGLSPLLHAVLTTQELGLQKRDPALYRRVAQDLGLSPGTCVLVDDSPVSCAAARAAGWYVVGVADPLFSGCQEQLREQCDLFLPSLEQFSPRSHGPTT